MTVSKLIDSSVWVEYLFNGKFTEIIDSGEVLSLCVLSVLEVAKKLKKEKIEPTKIATSLDFMKKRSLLIPVSLEIVEKAINFSEEYALPTVDALIYATAFFQHAQVFTCDNDFRGLPGAIVLKV